MSEVLTRGRSAAEALMVDTGQARRPTGTAYDPVEQEQVTTYDPDFGFTSRCKIQASGLTARNEEVGERTATSVRLELHLPVGTEPLRVDDVWEMTAIAPGSLMTVGQRLRVTAPFFKTEATARRYEVVEVVT